MVDEISHAVPCAQSIRGFREHSYPTAQSVTIIVISISLTCRVSISASTSSSGAIARMSTALSNCCHCSSALPPAGGAVMQDGDEKWEESAVHSKHDKLRGACV